MGEWCARGAGELNAHTQLWHYTRCHIVDIIIIIGNNCSMTARMHVLRPLHRRETANFGLERGMKRHVLCHFIDGYCWRTNMNSKYRYLSKCLQWFNRGNFHAWQCCLHWGLVERARGKGSTVMVVAQKKMSISTTTGTRKEEEELILASLDTRPVTFRSTQNVCEFDVEPLPSQIVPSECQ